MVGKGVLVYCGVFTLALTFSIFPFAIPAYATIDVLKFDQQEIPNGHTDVISIIDYMGFEPTDQWSNVKGTGDDNNCWIKNTLNTPSSNTGPSSGADGTPGYVFYEASYSHCSKASMKKAFLDGPVINFDIYEDVTVDFFYHMWDGVGSGSHLGILTLQLIDDTGNVIAEPWSESGRTPAELWFQPSAPIDLSGYSGELQLRFVASDHKGQRSDLALDEIKIQNVPASGPQTVISFEDFDEWTNIKTIQGESDDNNCWIINTLNTPSGNTGPSSGADGTSGYAFYEASFSHCAISSMKKAFLDGPVINFDTNHDVKVGFSYHMWDGGTSTNQMGKLTLQLIDDTGNVFDEIWEQNGRVDNNWHREIVDLTGTTGEWQLRFVASDHIGQRSDMAVDEIIIRGVPDVPPADYEVTVESVDSSGNIRSSIDVTIPYRDTDIFWTMVEFGPDEDEPNQKVEVADNDIVRVIDAEGNTADATIITSDDQLLLPPAGLIIKDPTSADCSTLPGAIGDNDVDKDGICDTWEDDIPNMEINIPSTGIYAGVYELNQQVCDSFIHDPKVGAVDCGGSDKRDIYVEIDYMKGHRPNEEALYQVIESFANAPAFPGGAPGIRLHIQLDDSSKGVMDHRDCIYWPFNVFHPLKGFDEIRTKHYGTDFENDVSGLGWEWGYMQKRQIFHYGMFVHAMCDSSTPPLPSGSSGKAETFGNDLMVSLGAIMNGPANPDHQSGTFMHELGHNLNLNHGGQWDDNINCKPNYLSVMNWARQFPTPLYFPDPTLDYSRMVIGDPDHPNSLMENDLDETPIGIDEYLHNGIAEEVIFGEIPPIPLPDSGGEIDWNLDGSIGLQGITEDVNYIPMFGCAPPNQPPTPHIEELMGNNDWLEGNIQLNVRDSNTWNDGRPLSAGFHTAVWEDGPTNSPIIPSLTCPSTKQVMDYVPINITKAAEDPSAPDHDLAKQKMREHFLNYRTCQGGVTISDPTILKATYLKGILLGMPDIFDHYVKNPEQLKDPKIRQTVLNAIDAALEYDKTGDVEKATEKLKAGNFTELLNPNKKQIILDKINAIFGNNIASEHVAFKESLFSLESKEKSPEDRPVAKTPKTEPEVNVWEVETIYGQSEFSNEAVVATRIAQLDSILEYLNNLESGDFKNNDKSVIQSHYVPIFDDSKSAILAGKMAEASMNMALIANSDYIVNPDKLQVLETSTQAIMEHYSRAIPEFGTIATLILVASITCIIILTTKTRNIFIPKNYQ